LMAAGKIARSTTMQSTVPGKGCGIGRHWAAWGGMGLEAWPAWH